ncbi:MAG: hypothetical protein L3J50_12035 [Emcibacter sp.]|nr:hypothetical protein [Emcibacter sp.]
MKDYKLVIKIVPVVVFVFLLGLYLLPQTEVEASIQPDSALNASLLTNGPASVYDEDIEAILDEQIGQARVLWELDCFQVTSGSGVIAMATVVLKDSTGQERMEAATGDGPIDAVYSAIQKATGVTVTLEDYTTRGITGGKDAQGEASVKIRHGDRCVRGRGLSTDVIEAAAKAYLAAINRIKVLDQRQSNV